MRRHWPDPAAATSGRHPDLAPLFQDPRTCPTMPGRGNDREMTLLTDHFVGRTEELGAFDQALDEVDQGRAAAIELVGEPGIGKTRLLAEFASRADALGRLVLSGSASELDGDLP